MRGDEIADLGAELIDQEGSTIADRPAGRGPDRVAHAWRQRREGQARQDIVGVVEAEFRDDRLDIGGGAMNRDEPVVVDVAVQIVDEVRIGIDRDQLRILVELVEDRAGLGSDDSRIID